MLQAILFDLDGTLANTDPIHRQVWQAVLHPYGIEVNPTVYQQTFSGRLNPDILQDLLPHLSLEQRQQLSQAKEAEFRRQARAQLRPLPGLIELLAWSKAHCLQEAIVTNAPRANAEFTLQTLGLTERFATVILADELPRGKPDPLPYQEGLRHLQVSPEAAVVFEDSPSGIRSAIATGILTIGVATTHEPQHLYDLGATLVISDFTDARLSQLGLLC
ncbi:Phosphorylated carbohydrates phosphatase [Halomicronema hongdechloris C2206]|uniref:Phosphorylated carbohydrates phosphatase n=1 Tax=Halomicronema hongdechloris C2206 TaxID=1641165 RepID=A0A1Z3HP19_9CYAN|nr:HAD family phosphatase [Halomicronema hongdechloris]ASC72063.1 Phosphorylated carbohydrates phosphatase [Halomicronema hongdechloris C2206]